MGEHYGYWLFGLAGRGVGGSTGGMDDPKPVLVLVSDLIFSTKIAGTAQALGTPVRMLRDPTKLAAEGGHRLMVDLNQKGAIAASIAWKNATGGQVIGFVSHVDGETIREARAGGIDRVIARSEFVRLLPELLRDGDAEKASSHP